MLIMRYPLESERTPNFRTVCFCVEISVPTNRHRALAQSLDEILRARYHGASNIAGVRYQLLYGLSCAFEVYSSAGIHHVQLEGIEDVDTHEEVLEGIWTGSVYRQAKHSSTPKAWGWFKGERILEHFLEVYRLQTEARFVVVTNFALRSDLLQLAQYCHGEASSLPLQVRLHISAIANEFELDSASVYALLGHISFEQVGDDEVVSRVLQGVVRDFAITAGNEELYLMHLLARAIGWAATRTSIDKRTMETERLKVQDWISLGTENPAVRDRMIVPVRLAAETATADFYEGKQARFGHIMADLDVPRPTWQQAIENAFEQAKVCVIQASSGQGKSTLLFRYARDHFSPDTIYRLRLCSQEEHVGHVADYLRNRLSLGVPLLVLIDNLSYSTRRWYQVAEELAGSNVRFLVTARQEDWARYGPGASGLTIRTIEPQLSLAEARDLFRQFQERGRVAPSVPSAAWAYEQVVNRRLLLEFVYLITKGQMMADRIDEQVKRLEAPGEDPAKLAILRLVATAQVYGARVPLQILLDSIPFMHDPQATLRALVGEYLVISDGECEGLHPVRSRYLMEALHEVVPVAQTLRRLIEILDAENLIVLTSNVFADVSLPLEQLVAPLVARGQAMPLRGVNGLAEALFTASEAAYFHAHQELFDEAVRQGGSSSLALLIWGTLPTGTDDPLQSLTRNYPDRPTPRFLNDLKQRFRSRDELGVQALVQSWLTQVLAQRSFTANDSLDDIGRVGMWCHLLQAAAPALEAYLIGEDWEQFLPTASSDGLSQFIRTLHDLAPQAYDRRILAEKAMWFERFRSRYLTLTIAEEEDALHITFLVDEINDSRNANDQAVWRLKQLRQWFPTYKQYRSTGRYAVTGGDAPFDDPAAKNLTAETLDILSLQAPRNVVYRTYVEDRYAAVALHDWAAAWDRARREGVGFAQRVLSYYESSYRGKHPAVVDWHAVAAPVLDLLRNLPDPPRHWKEAFATQLSMLMKWSAHLSNFIGQYPLHDSNDGQQHLSHLMRFNLKDVVKLLPAVHDAFTALSAAVPDGLSVPDVSAQETRVYPFLADVLDYWFSMPRTRVPNLRQTVAQWRTQQRETFARHARRQLRMLADQGMDLLYPVGPLYDHPLTGLCIGFEVIDFRHVPEQAMLIAMAVAGLEEHYDFLYLVPTLLHHQYGARAWRFPRQTVLDLAGGKRPQSQILPVELPEGSGHILSDLDITPLPDLQLIHALARIEAEMRIVRNMVQMARIACPNPAGEEAELARHYETLAYEKGQQLRAELSSLRQQADVLPMGGATSEWRTLWSESQRELERLADMATLDPHEQTPSLLGTSGLDSLTAEYLNRRYRPQISS